MMSECQDWESLDWAIVFEDQDHDTMYIPDKAVALKLFEAKASNWNCHLFYRVSSEAGIDYPPSEMQVLQKEKQQQAETIEKMDRDFDELAHKDTEKAETIKQLQARIARLEEKLGAHVHIKKIGLFNAKESDFRALDNSESVLNEAPQQSYSAIQADAIMEFKHHILNVLIGDDGDDIIIAQSVFDDYSDQLRQKTKGGG